MTALRLILRSLVYYRRTHIGTVIGAAICTTVLTGALLVGDSVRLTLKSMALARLGKTEWAMATGERFFRARLANEIATSLERKTAPVFQLRGIATIPDSGRRANRITVMGVDKRFWALTGADPSVDGGTAINRRLADKLDIEEGDEIVLRIDRPGLISRDDPFFSENLMSSAMRLTIKTILDDSGSGRFSLRSSQVPPLNIFLPLSVLAEKAGMDGRANILLVEHKDDSNLNPQLMDKALRDNWRLDDASLSLKDSGGGKSLELRSGRVFIDPPVVDAVLKTNADAKKILTYLVNDIGSKQKHCPYSFVSAPGAPLVSPDMSNDEIIINEWLADDLDLKTGDTVTLTYYTQGPLRTLEEGSSSFRIKSIVPISGPAADPELAPIMTGISEAANCQEWDSGIAIDIKRIRNKDEKYWNTNKGTPKAFVTLVAAQKMWSNRFGSLTGMRLPKAQGVEKTSRSILDHVDPASLGFTFHNVRQEGLRAGIESLDLSGYFIGLSFFIIIAAMLLTGLLFAFNIEQRSSESGTLLALGFSLNQVRMLLMSEGLLLAIVGALFGSLGGILYNKAVLHGLNTLWQGAVGTSSLQLHIRLSTVVTGCVVGTAVSAIAMWLAIRKQADKSISSLQSKADGQITGLNTVTNKSSLFLVLACAVSAAYMVVTTDPGKGREAAGTFFTAGSLLLASGLVMFRILFALVCRPSKTRLNLILMGLRNCARQKGRSVTVMAILACGIFIVIAVGSNRSKSAGDDSLRESGTGGFAFYGETSVPVMLDLNDRASKEKIGLDDSKYSSVRFVQMMEKEGDDASCLNLNRTRKPRILAVRPSDLDDREAFSFVNKTTEGNSSSLWSILSSELGQDAVAGIADHTVIQYGLGMKIGDHLFLTDERGRSFKIKLVAGLASSIFQGSVIISKKAFLERFPSTEGTRVLLVDSPAELRSEVDEILTRSMRDKGLELDYTSKRLLGFTQVENTYLSIFFMLGALGVLLGSIGLGVVVLRNVTERRKEFAILRATGYSRRMLYWLVMSEHGILLLGGSICGAVAAVVASMPALLTPGTELPFGVLAGTLAGVFINGLLWTATAAWAATRNDFLVELMNE